MTEGTQDEAVWGKPSLGSARNASINFYYLGPTFVATERGISNHRKKKSGGAQKRKTLLVTRNKPRKLGESSAS